jgi:hypothetical protein
LALSPDPYPGYVCTETKGHEGEHKAAGSWPLVIWLDNMSAKREAVGPAPYSGRLHELATLVHMRSLEQAEYELLVDAYVEGRIL